MQKAFEPLPFTLSKKLTPKLRTFLYELYLALHAAPEAISLAGRYRTLETAAVAICSWHIDAISVEALEHLVTERTAKGLRRGHRMARKERGARLFDPTVPPMGKAAMLRFFFENDRVTLVRASENGKNGVDHWSAQIAVPPGYFEKGSYSVTVEQRDLDWAEDALRRYRAEAKKKPAQLGALSRCRP